MEVPALTELSPWLKPGACAAHLAKENQTTQTCSCYGVIPASSPKGRAGLRIREWSCSECGTGHDRDANEARNIRALRHQSLAGETSPTLDRASVKGPVSQGIRNPQPFGQGGWQYQGKYLDEPRH